ncbi:ABC transporter permease [Haliea sp. E17]|uniref:ABC transporter permease n=1 Tax=Haliea sp. E17 TaxID=3401576 RepID=UPI003AAFA781
MTLSQYFGLVDVQARMLLKADAAKFKLGFLWWFLEPLMWVCVFYIVFNLILDSGRRSGDFILFLATGKFAFIWFSKTVIQASGSIVASQGLVGKIDIPKSLFPMAAIQESLYRQSTIYLLLLVFLLAGGVTPGMAWFWMLPLLLVFYLLIIACGFIGACLVCIMRDFMKFIPLGMTFLLFTSGIFWDIREIDDPQKIDLLLTVNPLAFIIDAHRQILMHNTAPDLFHLASAGIGAMVLIWLALLYMRRYSQYLALQVLT